MQAITATRQTYAWGSTDGIAAVLGEPPSRAPLAEYWLGAHPKSPAQLPDGGDLLQAIAADPAVLGARGRAAFGDRLPFLLKLLSARTALSIQAHPSRAQAEEGFARENAAGLALDAPDRNYRDDWPKPEGVLALTEFDALCGFREPEHTQELFARLGVPAAADLVSPLHQADGIAQVFLQVLALGEAEGSLISQIVAAARDHIDAGTDDPDFQAFCRTAVSTAADFPKDPGVLAALLLNRVTLAPGEGLALGAGNVHAYLRGTAVEIMSNSDNVLRGGLTSKHVDVDELARVVDFAANPVQVLTWQEVAPGLWRFPAEVTEFALWEATDVELPAVESPRVALALSPATVTAGDQVAELTGGGAVFLPADEEAQVSGTVLVASHNC